MLIAFAVSMAYQTRRRMAERIESGERFSKLLLLQISDFVDIIPAVFFLNGLYTHVRSYPTTAKLERFTVVVLLSLTVFIT